MRGPWIVVSEIWANRGNLYEKKGNSKWGLGLRLDIGKEVWSATGAGLGLRLEL